MSRILKLAGTIFLAAVFCLTFISNGVASAASNSSTNKITQRQAMRMFRESLIATANDNNNIFHQFFMFLMPDVQFELDFNGKVTGHSLDVAGDFDLWITGNDGKPIDVEVPFYLQQQGDKMMIYYQQENKDWAKYAFPSAAAALADIVASPTREEIEKEIAMVKEVTVLQDNENRRTLLVRLDGNKLADEFQLQIGKEIANIDSKNPEADEFINQIMGYIDTGLRTADVWYTWTIDKKNRKTGRVVLDCSQIIQKIALAALNDPKSELPDPINEILERLAFYSEFKAYTTLLGPEAQTSLIIPQEVLINAKEDKSPSLDEVDGK